VTLALDRAPVSRRTALRVGLLSVVVLASCWKAPTDDERIHQVIQDIVAGAVDGDVGDVLIHVSHKYRSDVGDYETLHALLVQAFLRRGPILVVPGPITVVVKGDTAHASFDAAIAEGTGQWRDIVPVNADGWHLEVDFAREDGDTWRVTRHERTSWSK
jgi:hypothetical protein